ncbi:predicted protein [Histoplasma capsulatum G186AR]|uniref:Uncharacterized protein n=1 Tax=Ajellomyces capsulatus (strain G186AR / H82 / ATCC MYA-2454 / RMSCC 2432) TaxID=447093 RepID=C0NF26_AJECG|nr:uncharacterized protein HCBG_01492 [Histoplasma capsulatum G186AR]EEH09847.1 predicted protein [Histoplasma capsulatum G186AR]
MWMKVAIVGQCSRLPQRPKRASAKHSSFSGRNSEGKDLSFAQKIFSNATLFTKKMHTNNDMYQIHSKLKQISNLVALLGNPAGPFDINTFYPTSNILLKSRTEETKETSTTS